MHAAIAANSCRPVPRLCVSCRVQCHCHPTSCIVLLLTPQFTSFCLPLCARRARCSLRCCCTAACLFEFVELLPPTMLQFARHLTLMLLLLCRLDLFVFLPLWLLAPHLHDTCITRCQMCSASVDSYSPSIYSARPRPVTALSATRPTQAHTQTFIHSFIQHTARPPLARGRPTLAWAARAASPPGACSVLEGCAQR